MYNDLNHNLRGLSECVNFCEVLRGGLQLRRRSLKHELTAQNTVDGNGN